MRLGERVLLALSAPPGAASRDAAERWTMENALAPLKRWFPDLPSLVGGRRVLDFGCGTGWQAAALARDHAAFVLGVDTNERSLSRAGALGRELGLGEDRLAFATSVPPERWGTFDVVVSQDSMEHFADPAGMLELMKRALRPGGRILLTFGPPWYAPSGSHMNYFTRVPWVNLLFSEETVMRARSRYRSDGARRYEEVESGLNRMSVAKFERLVAGSGLQMERVGYRCVKGLDFVAALPVVRELLVNNVSCVLVPARSAG